MSIVLNTRLQKNMPQLWLCLFLHLILIPFLLAATFNALADPTALITNPDTGDNNPSVHLSAPLQTQAGIKTQQPELTQYQAEFQATANVVDLQPLLNLREQYLTALAEHQGVTAALNFARQAVSRTEALYRDGVNSQRQLQGIQMQLSTDQAHLNSSLYRLQSINDNLLANWGGTISTWVKANNSAAIQAFFNAQQALLLINLPASQSLPENLTQIFIDPNGNRQKSQIAHLISKAPKGSEISQGETYFFQTPRANLRTGMRLSAWLAAPGTMQTGFIIPSTALIWHGGQPVIYLKIAPEQFRRQTVKQYYLITQGYFIADTLPDHAEIVTTGAQLLLSQELRAIIPTEDDNTDD